MTHPGLCVIPMSSQDSGCPEILTYSHTIKCWSILGWSLDSCPHTLNRIFSRAKHFWN